MVPLGQACSLLNGRAFGLHEWEAVGVPVIRLQNLTGGDSYYYSTMALAPDKYCISGDLLYMWSATFGPYVWRGPRAIYHYHIWKVVPRAGMARRHFLYHKLREITTEQRTRATNGGTMLHLTKRYMESLPVLLPSPAEQELIGGALSDADALIDSLERLIAKKRQIKLGAMQELLTGKRRLPGFGGEWERRTLGSFGRCFRGVSFDPTTDLHSELAPSTVMLLRAQNVQLSQLNYNDVLHVSERRVSTSQLLRPGDIVICMANGSRALVGKSAVFNGGVAAPTTIGAFMALFRTECSEGQQGLVPYLFDSHAFRTHIDILLAGSSINNLTPGSVESCELDVPTDREEQRAIAAVLTDMDAEVTALESRLEKARRLKQGMMQQLLTGRIRLPVVEEEAVS